MYFCPILKSLWFILLITAYIWVFWNDTSMALSSELTEIKGLWSVRTFLFNYCFQERSPLIYFYLPERCQI